MENFKHNSAISIDVDQPEWMEDDEWSYRENLVEQCSSGLKSMGLGIPLAFLDPLVRFLKGEIDQDELGCLVHETRGPSLH